MKALVYHGPRDVRIADKPKPKIEHPEDAIIKVTTTAICGSDLHLYHGTVPGMEPGQTLGHEFMGVVQEVGPEVHEVKPGDRVVVPFNVSCGRCWFCRHEYWSQCERTNPKGEVGAGYGYGQVLGGYEGGQAEYVRVPYANTNPLRVPDHLKDEQVIFLSDIFPTGYFGCELAGVGPGDEVAVFGAGPVGYFATLSAFLKGAARVFSIDRIPARLARTAELGAETIHFDEQDPVKTVREATGGRGALCVDAVGYEAVEPRTGKTNPVQVLTWAAQCARKFSTLGVPGVYMSSHDSFPIGLFFSRAVQLGMGQCPVKRYNEPLLEVIEAGRADPTRIISNVMRLEEAPEAYEAFDKKDGVTKVILKP